MRENIALIILVESQKRKLGQDIYMVSGPELGDFKVWNEDQAEICPHSFLWIGGYSEVSV